MALIELLPQYDDPPAALRFRAALAMRLNLPATEIGSFIAVVETKDDQGNPWLHTIADGSTWTIDGMLRRALAELYAEEEEE